MNEVSKIALESSPEEMPKSDYVEDTFLQGMKAAFDDLPDDVAADKISAISQNDWDDCFTDFVDKVSKDKTLFYKNSMLEYVPKLNEDDEEFLMHQKSVWGNAFTSFDAMYHITLEFSQRYGMIAEQKYSPQERESLQYRFVSLRELHGRACQCFLEISCLIKNGFPDAAYARWRLLFELWITAVFINKHGEEVAVEFLKSSSNNDGWPNWAKAANCFRNHKGNISFSMIKKQCHQEIDIWSKHCLTANQTTHASSQGTLNRLGIKDERSSSGNPEYIPAGRSDYGLSLPAEHAAICFALISKEFFGLFPCGESIVTVNCLTNWIDIVRYHFFKTESEYFRLPQDKYGNFFSRTDIGWISAEQQSNPE